jgi:hypothetical protein
MSLFDSFEATAKMPQQELNSKPEYQLLKTLQKIDNEPEEMKSRTAVFVPQSNYLYWNSFRYLGVHFLTPAFSGEALLKGMQPFVPLRITSLNFERFLAQIRSQEDKDYIISSYEINSKTEERELKMHLNDQQRAILYSIFQPINSAELRGGFGYDLYQMPSQEQFLQETGNDEKLCQIAREKKFDRIIFISNQDKTTEARTLNCK